MKTSLASKVIYYSPIGRLSKTIRGFSFFVLNKAIHTPTAKIGATTFSIMTLSIVTFSITTFNIMTFAL